MRAWFELTHEVEAAGMGPGVCRCVRLPEAGGVADQEAWLWDALSVMRDEANAIIRDSAVARA